MLLLPAAGCATAPVDELRASYASVALAVDAGAAELAPAELARAREKIGLAERWIAAEDYAPARWLAEQARVDAELAALKARAARVR